ncbi:MAG: hypothetical protein IJL17_01820 [Kiritimatiellae bacterium]|nr:hypothetical protein [Kiritimatiellia bacterium]
MENDRILLMNNDSKIMASVTYQGYYNTNTNDKTYWVHDSTSPGFTPNLLRGITHTMYRKDGTRLWHLDNCRAGSGTVISNMRNYIPWSTTAKSITNENGTASIAADAAGVKGVGSVIFRNTASACLYSPYYEEGIGTIYWDCVNAFVNHTDGQIALEIATDVTPAARDEGITFASVTDNYNDLDWRPCPFNVFAVENASGPPIPLAEAVTNMTLASTATGGNLFYRARAQLNYYGPIRFRIRRLNDTGGNLDTTALILLDNIIASYPPMTARLHRHGTDYDDSLKGSEVLGCVGDFSTPFQAFKSGDSTPLAWFEFVTNSAARVSAKILNPQLHYRWRYLNQIISPWETIPFDQSSISSTSVTTSNLVGQTALPLTDGVGDIEYYYTAEIDAPYYLVRDYACNAGYGEGWTERITAITNRATYTAADALPSGGTDYFVRIREGESDLEWVELQGTLSVSNAVTGGNEVVRILTPDGTVPRLALVGDHTWRYHYQIPTNAVGGKLSFKLVTKEYYTNDTDATSASPPAFVTWLVRTNTLYSAENIVTEIPYTATLAPSNPNEISVALDDASTHLKIEYDDAQNTFSLSHASYQNFNHWTDAMDGYRAMAGGSDSRRRYDVPVDEWTTSGEVNSLWKEDFYDPEMNILTGERFSIQTTPNGWTAYNSRFVENTRADSSNLALALGGQGEGALAMDNFSEDQLPLGLDSVEFTARLVQPIRYEDFATYMDGHSCTNYAISAKITMSHQYETSGVKPSDMSPVNPSVSFVGYHRGTQGCYEFRMTRTTDTALELAFYKWTGSGGGVKPTLLAAKRYSTNLLVPTSASQASGSYWTSAYFLVYTLPDGSVKLEGHLASSPTQGSVYGGEPNLVNSVISYTDANPGILARGGTYGVGATDCRAGFGAISFHDVVTPPDSSTDAVISYPGTLEGPNRLAEEWAFYDNRWEIDTISRYQYDGGFTAVIPSNQVVEVWLSDASATGGRWYDSGYAVTVNSFASSACVVSPRLPGLWKVRLQTGQDEDVGVVLDDVAITPWEGENRWGSNGNPYLYSDEWVYTKAWVTPSATITRNGQAYTLPNENIQSVGTNGNVFIFNEPGTYTFVPTTDMVIDRALLVGGGGSGGSAMGGGGGGGGVVEADWIDSPITVAKGTMMTIIVGAGGAAPVPVYSSGSANATSIPAGKSGGDSRLTGLPGVSLAAAKGGGGGASWTVNAQSGGSGGGGANTRPGAAGTTGQGNAGGAAAVSGSSYGLGGGGGGAGHAGEGAQTSTYSGGNGGDGRPSDITGDICYYGAGGGGGVGWKNTAVGGMGGLCGPASGTTSAGHGANYQDPSSVRAGLDGYGGGGGGGTYISNNSDANVKKGAGAKGGDGTVILRVRTAVRECVLQPSRGKDGYPMGIRTPYIGDGMSLFTYSYANADSNCVLLVQIATNMAPSVGTAYVPGLTESLATNGDDVVWTTIARHDFSTMSASERASGSQTVFIGLRQHQIYDSGAHELVNTNVCGLIRVIVDPAIVFQVVNAPREERDALVDYGKITITKAHCYNEPPLNSRSWLGWNIHTEGWDGAGNAGRFAYLPDWPDGLSCSLNFSARAEDNYPSSPSTLGIGLGEPDKATEYATQNPFVQSAVLANGIGTVSFRARLFDTNAPGGRAVVTLYGGTDPSQDQVKTEGVYWHVLTNFVVTSPTYQSFEWTSPAAESDYQAIRLEMAGARWGRCPSALAAPWEWGDLCSGQYGASSVEPVNRVFIDDVSVSEVVLPSGPSAIAVDFGGKTISLSTAWVSQMMGRPTDWVEGNHASVKASLESTAANGRLSVVECYALGLDPEVATDDLVITEFPMKANGMPDLANLKYEPSADKWNLPGIAARILGAPDLVGPWQEVQEGNEASLRFFKIVIVVP